MPIIADVGAPSKTGEGAPATAKMAAGCRSGTRPGSKGPFLALRRPHRIGIRFAT